MECQGFIYRLVRKMRSQAATGKRLRGSLKNCPVPADKRPPGRGNGCTEAIAGHSRRVVKCAVQGENRSASRRDLSRTSSFSSVPKASGSWETAERISNSKGSMGNIQRKNLAKVPYRTEYNPIRPFVEKVDGLSFCQRSLPLRTWLKICSASQLKCYIAAGASLVGGYAISTTDPKYPRCRQWRQGLLCRRAGVLKANGKSPKAQSDEIRA